MLDSPIFLALAIAVIAGVLVYVLVQRLNKRGQDTPPDTRGVKLTTPRRVPQRIH
jgi:predicted PurR-regulated permease PerM